ncbi:mandelate racemase/muconate lactonizing enzyme family protein [Afifella sp. IM 167]|uniref:mandelate racemase/muconate lactonizing enzyme family protein n=1 Tax=Afifella sp. IM 167 TaxID=2033586 RepID=UPI001CCDB928|nr:mandelate racemase/muconate lactonizing enzyme family protein [Afifella sp. IM 167]MBZ8135130.1 hypothetical protein [Afifella sp. IM 167]
MKIENLELREIRTRLPSAFSGGTYRLNERAALLCRITATGGVTGIACVGNETVYGPGLKALVREAFREFLVGSDPTGIETHWQRMLGFDKAYIDRPALMGAIAAVDAALWDLKGHITGLPVWKLLGGNQPRVPVIGIGGYYETSAEESGIREEIRRYRQAGLGGIKFKVGARSIEEDVERLRIARDEAGPGFIIVADSNMAWTVPDAIRFAEAILRYDPEWLEEPVRPRELARGLREVRWKTGIRTAAGQSEPSVFDAYQLIASEAADVVNVTYNRGGGISGWMKLASAASFSGVRMGQVGEPHISMHLMAAISNHTCVECYPDPARDPFWANLYTDRPEPADGCITAPDRPGFGLTFDEDAIERYAVEPWA